MIDSECSVDADDIIKGNVEFEAINLTFDDGVKLTIRGANPRILTGFFEYQRFDPTMTSIDAAGHIIDWFRSRGCRMELGIDERVGKWNPWRLVCRYRISLLKERYLYD